MPSDEIKEAQKRYNSDPVSNAARTERELRKTAAKIPADKSEQKVTTSTEGSVEKTTERTGDRG